MTAARVVFLLVFLLACAPVRASDAAVRRAIQAQYDRWATAYVKNDVPTLLSILAPDFTLQTGSGKSLSRKAYEAILRKRSPSPAPMTYKTRVNRLRVSGRTARAYTTETITQAETDPQTKESGQTTHVHHYVDGWTRRGARWRLQSSQTLSESKSANTP